MKKLIGILLSIAMLVSVMPVWADEEPVNLLDMGGVTYSASGPGLYGTELLDAFDGNENTRAYVNTSGGAYFQLELPCAMQITSVQLTGRHDSTEGSTALDISLANNADFTDAVSIGTTTSIDKGATVDFTNTDSTKYKYIRVSHKNLVCLAEIDVYGYYVTPEHAAGPEGVEISDLSVLSTTTYASNPDPAYSTTLLNGVSALDNKICYLYGKNKPIWFMMDFGAPCRVNEISVIGAKTSGDKNVNQCIIEASNDADFSRYDILGFEMTSKDYGFGEGPVFSVYTENEYRYIRVRKEQSTSNVNLIFDKVTVNGYLNADPLTASVNVENGATNVTDDIVISFNKAINSDSVYFEHIIGSSHACSAGTLELNFEATASYVDEIAYSHYLSDDRQQIIMPINQFDSRTEYTLILYDASTKGCTYQTPVSSIFGDVLGEGKTISFTTGDVTVSEYIPDNAGLKNVLLNKIPTAASSNVTELNSLDYLTNGGYEGNKSIAKTEGVTNYVTYDLLAEYDIYSLNVAWTSGGYKFGNILVYGSNDGIDFEQCAALTSNSAAINGVMKKVVVFDEPCKYRYIKFSAKSANTAIRPCEFVVYGAVTDALAEKNYDILACDISKNDSGDIVASTGITNTSGAQITSPVFILAVYNVADGTETLVATASVPARDIANDAGANLTASVSSTALDGKTYNKAKLFIFDSVNTLEPVCRPLIVTDIAD